MTPYLTWQAVTALADESMKRDWMLATMIRAKKLPPLEKLLSSPEKKNDIGMDLKAALMGIKGKRK
jgi:hypothetical protein